MTPIIQATVEEAVVQIEGTTTLITDAERAAKKAMAEALWERASAKVYEQTSNIGRVSGGKD